MSGTEALLSRLSTSVEAGRGADAAACFTVNGTYRDVFYGLFVGRDAIADMVENRFHRDGADIRWDFLDPAAAGDRVYARYLFSSRSRKDPDAPRAAFEGVAILLLRDGLISTFEEVANPYPGLARSGLSDERLAAFARREADALTARPEARRHVAD